MATMTALLITRREVRRLLNCSDSLIRGLERRGRLKPLLLGSGKRGVRYRRAEVLALAGFEQSQPLET